MFGRKFDGKSGSTIGRGPPGIGYKLTDEGNYDAEYKRLCDIGKPENPSDAVNLGAVQSLIEDKTKELSDRSTDLIKQLFEQIEERISKIEQIYYNDTYAVSQNG